MSPPLAFSVALSLAHACAPQVAPVTLVAVARAESGLDPLTIGVNSVPHRALHPRTREGAVRAASALLAHGANVDLGLTQINVRNLGRLGLSLEAAFDPCRNLAAGGRILTENYLSAQRGSASQQGALQAALSLYNTGDATRGLSNGYVAHVYRAALQVVPSMVPSESPAPQLETPVALAADTAPPVQTPPQSLDVFAPAATTALVWTDPPPFAPPALPRRSHPSRPGDPS